jgi:hypothetical protein
LFGGATPADQQGQALVRAQIFQLVSARPIKDGRNSAPAQRMPRVRLGHHASDKTQASRNRRAMFCPELLRFRLPRVVLEDFCAEEPKARGFLARFGDSPTCCFFGASIQPLYTGVV